MILTFLQNAWFHRPMPWLTVGTPRYYHLWLYALATCHSGRRLRLLLGEDCFERAAHQGRLPAMERLSEELGAPSCPQDRAFENTTPEIGYGRSSIKLPPQPAHCLAMLDKHQPRVVVCCGEQAREAVATLWQGPLLAVPHPASRLLTNALYEEAAGSLARMASGEYVGRSLRLRYLQEEGSHRSECLDQGGPHATGV